MHLVKHASSWLVRCILLQHAALQVSGKQCGVEICLPFLLPMHTVATCARAVLMYIACQMTHDGTPGAPKRDAADEYSTDVPSGSLAAAWQMATDDASFGAATSLQVKNSKTLSV